MKSVAPVLFPELFFPTAARPVNVASVPQRSPFRYPGGKTWLIPIFRQWIEHLSRPSLLIEPFAGGGIISLTTAFEDRADKVLMIEIDKSVAAVWKTILSPNWEWLSQQILHFQLTPESARQLMEKKALSLRETAFQTLVQNRTAHGGILADGAGVLKNGENGKGILSRWYPQTIARRIRDISMFSEKIAFIEGDGLETMLKHKKRRDAAYFIDPPYTIGGKRAGNRLYRHCQLDHDSLFALCGQIEGDFLMTYDNAPEVREMADRHSLASRPITMKSTHHAEMTELLISKDFSWLV